MYFSICRVDKLFKLTCCLCVSSQRHMNCSKLYRYRSRKLGSESQTEGNRRHLSTNTIMLFVFVT